MAALHNNMRMTVNDWKRLMNPAVDLYNRSFPKAAGKNGDEVPTSAVPTLAAIAASIKQSAAGMGQWSMAELTIGLYKVAMKHALEGAADTIEGAPVTSRAELTELLHWLHWAMAAYEFELPVLASNLGIPEGRILKHVTKSAVKQPAYYIAIDDQRKCIVIGIRGTHGTQDVLTDLTPHSEWFETGYAHSGMLGAARWLLAEEGGSLQDAVTANPGYSLVATGHSLGAGTAALLAMLLRESAHTQMPAEGGGWGQMGLTASQISCWAYACPPVVDCHLAEVSEFIRTIVLQDDVVARVSPASLEDLRTEILQTDWSTALPDGTLQKRLITLVQNTDHTISSIEASGGFSKGHFYNEARKLGLGAVAAAGKAMASGVSKAQAGTMGTRAKSTAGWLSAAAVLGSALVSVVAEQASQSIVQSDRSGPAAAHKRGQSGVDATDSEVAAAAVAANVGNQGLTKEQLDRQRLYAPGILYHIVRKPLEVGEGAPMSVREVVEREGGIPGPAGAGGKGEVEFWMVEEKDLRARGVDTGAGSEDSGGEYKWWWKKAKVEGSQGEDVDGGEGGSEGGRGGEEERGEGGAVRREGEGGELRSGGENSVTEKAAAWLVELHGKVAGMKVGEDGKGRKSTVKIEEVVEGEGEGEGGGGEKGERSGEGSGGGGGEKLFVDYPRVEVGRKGGAGEGDGDAKKVQVRHIVMKQTNPKSRFKRIVLTSTMLADHACKPYGDAIINAMQWA